MIKSLPETLRKFRNSVVTLAQIVCDPRSLSSVLQHPSLNQPVSGSWEQLSRGPPSTFIAAFITTFDQIKYTLS